MAETPPTAPTAQTAPTPQAAPPATAGETTPENPWTLREFAEKLKWHIERAPQAWVEAQIVELNRRGQSTFVTLRDVDAEVSLSASSWGGRLDSSAPGITAGARVVAQIKPQMWLKSGKLSMSLTELRPVGLGDLLARIERLRQTLAAEGLFDPRRKKRLPVLPERIGLITGRNSDAEKDVLRNATLRWPSVQFEIRNVAVQGVRSAAEVTAALQELDADPRIEVIIIARGGGSLEDLLSFSDEGLVRAVAAARTPVVSAIGHEADHPVLDDVADLRASTPTDAAKRVVPDLAEEQEQLKNARWSLERLLSLKIEREFEMIRSQRSRPAMLRPESIFENHRMQLGVSQDRLRRALSVRHERERMACEHTLARVRSLSPQQTLNRGYAVLQSGDRVITDASEVSPGEAVRILVARGRVQAEVTGSEPAPDEAHPTQH